MELCYAEAFVRALRLTANLHAPALFCCERVAVVAVGRCGSCGLQRRVGRVPFASSLEPTLEQAPHC
jgi:hypothetical protein